MTVTWKCMSDRCTFCPSNHDQLWYFSLLINNKLNMHRCSPNVPLMHLIHVAMGRQQFWSAWIKETQNMFPSRSCGAVELRMQGRNQGDEVSTVTSAYAFRSTSSNGIYHTTAVSTARRSLTETTFRNHLPDCCRLSPRVFSYTSASVPSFVCERKQDSEAKQEIKKLAASRGQYAAHAEATGSRRKRKANIKKINFGKHCTR